MLQAIKIDDLIATRVNEVKPDEPFWEIQDVSTQTLLAVFKESNRIVFLKIDSCHKDLLNNINNIVAGINIFL